MPFRLPLIAVAFIALSPALGADTARSLLDVPAFDLPFNFNGGVYFPSMA